VAQTTNVGIEELFSNRARLAGPGMVGSNPRGIAELIAFAGGYPDASSLPIQDIIESARIALERDGEWALQYAFGTGVPELVEQLLAKLGRDQGIRATPENILITNGSSQALQLIFELFLNPGDVIVCESPCFMGALWRMRASGADVREIPLDRHGLDIGVLAETLEHVQAEGRRAKLLYLVPNFQNPTGITYTLERRRAIVALAQQHGLPILEDDAYHDLRFDGTRQPTLYELAGPDGGGLVMYCGTFSKIMAAGVRLGWVVAARQLIAALSGLKADGGTNPFASHIAAQFAASGTLQEHISALKPLYKQRRDVMLRALEQHMPAGTTWTIPEGGFFIWLTLPGSVTCQAIAPIAQQRGVSIAPGTMFFAHGAGQNQVRLSYSFNDDETIERGVRILGEVVTEQLAAM
jgi:DNA-binding transcriptional MocR family regulator